MPKKHSDKRVNDTMSLLRREAERVLSGVTQFHDPHFSGMDIKDLLHNVQVQQIELEMQNDELRISNEQLELQRARFAGLFDLAPVGYFILDRFGVIQDANSAALQLLEIEKKRICNKRFLGFVSSGDNGKFSSFLQNLRFADSHTCQIEMQTTTGKIFYAQIQGTSAQQPAAEMVHFYIGVIDITERINDAQKLSQANERLNISLNASSAGTWEINLKTGRIILDDYSKKIFGFKEGDFDGRSDTFLKIIHPEDRDTVQAKLLLALNSETELDIDYRVIKRKGQICYVAIRGHVVYGENEINSFVGIVIDIHQRRQLEDEARLLKINQQKTITAATLRTQENERKRISETLHDSLSQLLYGIKLNLQNPEPGNEESAKVTELLERAIQEARDIAFELAPSVLTDFGLSVTINEMCKRLSGPKLTIKAVTQGLKQRPNANMEISIFRIIQELVNNAIKHGMANRIDISLVKKNTIVTINVQDNGKGFIYPDDESSLNGSGLASIRNRLSLYNGILNIDSQPAKGTKVSITLIEAGDN